MDTILTATRVADTDLYAVLSEDGRVFGLQTEGEEPILFAWLLQATTKERWVELLTEAYVREAPPAEAARALFAECGFGGTVGVSDLRPLGPEITE